MCGVKSGKTHCQLTSWLKWSKRMADLFPETFLLSGHVKYNLTLFGCTSMRSSPWPPTFLFPWWWWLCVSGSKLSAINEKWCTFKLPISCDCYILKQENEKIEICSVSLKLLTHTHRHNTQTTHNYLSIQLTATVVASVIRAGQQV